MDRTLTPAPLAGVFPGESAAAELMRATDWSLAPIGEPASWPQSLRTGVGLMLHSRFPMVLFWGRDFVMLYNDGYSALIGDKHPAAMGRPAREVLPEIWDLIGPMLRDVLDHEASTWSRDETIPLQRHGFVEECYFTFAFSVAPDDLGRPGGVFCAATETTERVRSERRLDLLRTLSATATSDVTGAAAVVLEAIGKATHDIPLAALYLGEGDGLASAMEPPGQSLPAPVASAIRAAADVAARDGTEELVRLDGAAAPEVLVLPLVQPGGDGVDVLALGRSPMIALDETYRAFFRLAAAHIARELASARAHEAERRRAEALAEIDRAKTAFFSNVSHEFRTPLTLMLGPLEDLLAGAHGELSDGQRAEIEMARRNCLRLLRLVSTLLEFTRIESGRVRAHYRRTDLPSLTADLASNFRSAVERAGLRLTVSAPPLPEGVEAWIDPEMWEQIVLNLLSNALKFTFAGEIAVAVAPVPDGVELTVRDTGTGVPARELPRLFDRFHRVRGARARTQEGSGIGLALVRELVRLHGGSVTAESEVGVGTTIRVVIPTGRAHLPPDRIAETPETPEDAATATAVAPFIHEAESWVADGSPVEPAVAGRTDRPRVLFVDDNADMRRYVGRLLAAEYEVIALSDGLAALEAARADPPDLILADVMMPGLDGFGLLRAIRGDVATREVPFMLLSARAGDEARLEGLEAGADDYLVKPFSARELLARVGTHLELRRVRSEAAERERAARMVAEASDERARLAIAVARLGTWRFDPERNLVHLDERMREIWGEPPDSTVLDLEVTLARIHPDDRDRVVAEVQATLDPAGTGDYAIEYRLLLPDGSLRWIAANGRALFEGDGPDRRAVLVVGTALDITTQKLGEFTLRESEAKLRDALSVKDQFLGLVSHELRTPMTVILGMSRLLDRPDVDPIRTRDIAADISSSAEALNGVVESMLLLARLDGEEAQRLREPILLARVAQRVLREQRRRDPGRTFGLEVADQDVFVDVQDTLAERVIDNLVGNAAKYTTPGTPITIVVEREDGHGVLRVLDDGPAPADAELDRLFEPFYRTAEARVQAAGAGLGLAVSKRIVELMDGRIWARARPSGGSEFGFALPLLAVPEV